MAEFRPFRLADGPLPDFLTIPTVYQHQARYIYTTRGLSYRSPRSRAVGSPRVSLQRGRHAGGRTRGPRRARCRARRSTRSTNDRFRSGEAASSVLRRGIVGDPTPQRRFISQVFLHRAGLWESRVLRGPQSPTTRLAVGRNLAARPPKAMPVANASHLRAATAPTTRATGRAGQTPAGTSTSGSARRPCWPAPCGRCRPCA
jgi:hypothetical protein